MTTESYYKYQKNNLLLELYIQPKASKDRIIGQHGNHLKIAITTSPTDGKANKHLIRFLAKYFGVTQNQVEIVKGNKSRYKSVLVLDPKNHLTEFQSEK